MVKSKYSRHELIPGWSQERLQESKVAVVGCGALGNEVLKNLSLLGVGHIWIIDYDTIEIHNLTRSVLFRESDVGRFKAEVAAERLQAANPDILVYPIVGKLELSFGRGLLRTMDVVIGCLDSIGARCLLNERCYFAGIPWIDGGISHFAGNVALFDPHSLDTACYRCKMTGADWAKINEKYSCPNGYLKDDYAEQKIATTAMTASVIAAYQVEIATQMILGINKFECGTQLFLPVSSPVGFNYFRFPLFEECPDHELAHINMNLSTQKVSLDETPQRYANKVGIKEWDLILPFDFVSNVVCECGYINPIYKPAKEIVQSQAVCKKCGSSNGTAMKFFKINHASEDADTSFRMLSLCEHEILQYLCHGSYISIELTSDI